MKPSGILLVEGRDDREVIYQLCNAHGIDNRALFAVKDAEGYSQLRNEIQVTPRTGVRVLGAVVDADIRPTDRWTSICDALTVAGYRDLPGAPVSGGFVLNAPSRLPRLGLWMMPNNDAAGILESFLAEIVAGDDQLIGLARSSVAALPIRLFPDVAETKAVLHTWLAWQEDPGTPTGQALVKHYLDPHHPAALRFVNWLRRLFAPNTVTGQAD